MKNRNKEIVEFLQELSENNSKEWFDLNRSRYTDLRNYFIEVISLLIAGVSSFDASVSFLDPKKSIFRINRDIRFSANKSPYKTNFGAFIVPEGKKSGNAGYYLHLEPQQSFVGGGIHRPQANILNKVRWSIYENIDDFVDILNEDDFISNYGEIKGEKLKNPPRGFDKSFKYVDLLKFKDYTVIRNLSVTDLTKPDFVDVIVQNFSKMYNFNLFINNALKK
ncbi:MAG: DUF2461 domain-containing protein [Bacteroidales bacterium]|nr:DUF2461 domain-containing protein [Bacteroidales bacterium]